MGLIAEIDVAARGDAFRVTVREASSETQHDVRVSDEYLARLGLDDVDRGELVAESFRFLLEREPKESIMRSFELSVIERYFPEYPDVIRRRL